MGTMIRWMLVLSLAGVCLARSATRVQPVSSAQSGITSLTDKDNKRKAMEHPAFAKAGQKAGVEVWRIENFEPVPVPASDIGKFYTGDSYIVLKTTADRKGQLSWDIHYWLGSKTSQDEAGAAAILTVGLDDKFNGAAVQHREVQSYESPQFLNNFQPAIRYLEGGHASGFHHVTTNAGAETRLFQIKGKRNVRVRQIQPAISSMNKGDCFILDKDNTVYLYVGEKAKRVERLKAISVANQIRDQDHHGRARVEIIDESATESDLQKFFSALGSGSRDLVPEESAGGDDQAFERGEESAVTLYEISDASGKLTSTPLPKPLKQDQLKSQECYILDTVSGSIYVWVGKQANQKEKTEAMSKAQQFLTSKNYPAWVHVARVPEGTEPAEFKQYFSTWKSAGELHQRIVRSVSEEELYASDEEVARQRARLIGKTGAARGFMPDDGQGHIAMYRIENRALVQVYDSKTGEVAPHKYGQLYQGDSYVMQYEYRTKDHRREHVIYYWLGKDSTKDEQAAAAIQATILDNELSGAAMQVRVPQGEEPKHFLKLFRGRLITLLGGKDSGFRGRSQQETQDNGVRLFQVFGTTAGVDMRAQQVIAAAKNLDDDDVFILFTPDKVFVWHGSGSTAVERSEAAEFAKLLGAEHFETVEKGSEPQKFWEYLGGAPTAAAAQPAAAWRERLQRVGALPLLYEASVATNNRVAFEQINGYKQEDMDEEDIYLLDTAEEVFVWIGREAPLREKKSIHHIVEQYFSRYRGGRTALSAVVVTIKQGLEPETFKNLFEDWDPAMWQKRKSYDALKEALLARNEV